MNASEVIALGREITKKLSKSIYTGNKLEFPLRDQEHWKYECALWYFDFIRGDNKYKYIGVLDIDVGEEMFYHNTEKNTMVILCTDILDEIKNKLEPLGGFDIYFSGKKGFHIYVFSKEFIINSCDIENIKSIWRNIFGENSIVYEYIDFTIYYENKGIRPIYIAHPDTNRMPSLIYTNRGDNHYTDIWWYILEDGLERFYIEKEIEKSIEDKQPQKEKQQQQQQHNHTNKIIRTNKFIYIEDNIILKDYLIKEYECEKISRKNKGYVYLPDNYKIGICLIKKYILSSDNIKHKYSKNYMISHDCNEYFEIRCHSIKCNKYSLIIKKKYEHICKVIENTNITIPIEQKYINEDNIKEVLSGEGYGLVFAPMGSGKTQALKKYLVNQGNDLLYWKMLMIVVRKSQAINFKETLKDKDNNLLEFESYLDYIDGLENRHKIHTINKLIICINSLAKILAPGVDSIQLSTIYSTIPVYDLLILDEIESILYALTSCLLNTSKCRQLLVYEIFVMIIKSSKRVIFMDGIPTEKRTISFLRHIGILGVCKSLQYLHYTDNRRYIYYGIKAFENKYLNDVKMNKRIVIISNIKKTLYLFHDMSLPYEGKQLVICGDSNKIEKDTVHNPSIEWKEYNRVFFNTVVGAGASYDIKIDDCGCFDIMYVVICVVSCDPQELYQLMNRIRHLKENKVCLLLLDTDNEMRQKEKKRSLKTVDEYRKNLCMDIYKFDQLCNLMKFKRQEYFPIRENTYLDIDTTDYKLVRLLCAEKKIRLQYENNYIIETIARDLHWRKYLQISINYKKELTLLINRNGGLVIDKEGMLPDKIRKKMSVDARGLLKRAREVHIEIQQERPIKVMKETKNQGIDGGIKIPEELKETLCKYIDFSKGEYQRNYMQLMRCLGEYDGISDLYEHEAFMYFSRKHRIFSNVLVFSTGLLNELKYLFTELLDLKLDIKTAKLSGTFKTENLLINQKKIYDNLVNIDKLMKAQSFMNISKEENMSEHSIYKLIEGEILKLLNYFGYRVDKYRKYRSRIKYDSILKEGKIITRQVTLYLFTINNLTMELRMALAGIDIETMEKSNYNVLACIQKFVNKYNSNK